MGARTKVSWAPVLIVVPLIGNAQLDMGADWPEPVNDIETPLFMI